MANSADTCCVKASSAEIEQAFNYVRGAYPISHDSLKLRILKEPQNALPIQYRALMAAENVTLEFTEGTHTPDETPEMLFENAVRDLAFMRELLA